MRGRTMAQPNSNLNQSEWDCTRCKMFHFGNCPQLKVSLTTTEVTEEGSSTDSHANTEASRELAPLSTESIDDNLEALIEKHTTALTSRNGVTSFDERVVDTFNLTKDLSAFIKQSQLEILKKACQDNWQKPIPEQYMLDKIKELEALKQIKEDLDGKD